MWNEAELSSSTPPGWYDDGHGALRWWDGEQWTEHTHPLPQPDGNPSAGEASSPAEAPVVTEASLVESQQPTASADTATPTDALPPVPQAPTGPAPVFEEDRSAHPATASVPAHPGPVPPHPGPVPPHPGSAPPYAGASPAQHGTADAPQRKSKLWIVFVVLGALLLGLIILAAVFIPRFVADLLDPTGGRPGDGGIAQDADMRAAEQIVADYDDAWDDIDCTAYQATLTPAYLTAYGYADCADFDQAATVFNESVDDYEVNVISSTREGDTIYVETVESFVQVLDEAGLPLENPVPGSFSYSYTLVSDGSGWLIDDFVESQP